MTTYLITRHPGAIEWFKQQGIAFDQHFTHLQNINQLQVGDTVIGTLPINLVHQLNQLGVSYLHLSLQIPASLRGQELSAEQLQQCQAQVEEFWVSKN